MLLRVVQLSLFFLAGWAHGLDPRENIERAVELIEDGKHTLARSYLGPALINPYLNSGERSRAYYLRGFSFGSQNMVVSALRDYHRALEFNPDNRVVLVEIGLAHAYGRGTEVDQALAFSFFEQAAQRDYPAGYFQVGHALLYGRGVEKNVPRAREELAKAAARDHLYAMMNLAASYRVQHVADPQVSFAQDWYEQAHTAGEPRALLFLGFMHANGEFGQADPVRAAAYYQQALDEGVAVAGVNLAYAYLTGTGVEEDVAHAFQLYAAAAEMGVAASYVGLGHMYEHGLGVAQSSDKAQRWYQRGAEAGVDDAMTRLVSFYLSKPDAGARAEALRWSQQAAAGGDAQAQNDYAWQLATSKFDELRNGTLALTAAQQAVAKRSNAAYLDTLAAAYAELGNFSEAVATQQQAIAAIGEQEQNIQAELLQRLELYQRSEPWRE